MVVAVIVLMKFASDDRAQVQIDETKRFAYVFYAASSHYLCYALINVLGRLRIGAPALLT
jgi:HEAT repeat protein